MLSFVPCFFAYTSSAHSTHWLCTGNLEYCQGDELGMVRCYCQFYCKGIRLHSRPNKLVRKCPPPFVPPLLVVCSDIGPEIGLKIHCMSPPIPIRSPNLIFLQTVFGSLILVVLSWIRVSGTIRTLSATGSFAVILVAQLLVGIIAPCFQVVGPRYAEVWFDLNGRATATMIVAICTYSLCLVI